MRRRGRWATPLAVVALHLVANAVFAGASPSDAASQADLFACGDGGGSIPRAWVDDDFCDCTDGSDEPGTSACEKARFYCENKGFVGEHIFASRVSDGLCDCCDGSDESSHPEAKCPNECRMRAEAAIKACDANAKSLRSALAVKGTWAKEAEDIAAKEQQELADLEAQLAALEPDLANVTKTLSALEEAKREADEARRKEEEEAERLRKANESEAEGEATETPPPEEGTGDAEPAATDPGAEPTQEGADGAGASAESPDGKAEGEEAWKQNWMRVDDEGAAGGGDGADAAPEPGADASEGEPAEEDIADMPDGIRSDDYPEDDYDGAMGEDNDDYPDDLDNDEYPDKYAGEDDDYDYDGARYGEGLDGPDSDEHGDEYDYDEDEDADGYLGRYDPDGAAEAEVEAEETEAPGRGLASLAGKLASAASRAYKGVFGGLQNTLLKATGLDLGGGHPSDGAAGPRRAGTLLSGVPIPAVPAWPCAEIDIVRKRKSELVKQKRSLNDRITALRDKAQIDYGPAGEFRKLHGTCYTHESPEYSYELCPFDKVTQKQNGRSVADLGNWKDGGWEGGEYRAMTYKQGAKCWNGPHRQTTVTVECGLTPTVHSVAEPEMCAYTMVLSVPAACSEEALRTEEKKAHDLREAGGKDEL